MSKKINIILCRSNKHLGLAGEVVEVNPGYFNNYLGPQKKAVRYTKTMYQAIQQKELEHKKQKQEFYVEQKKLLAQNLDNCQKPYVEFSENVSSHGLLYGAITTDRIVKAFNDKYGTDINKKQISLEYKIKAISPKPYIVYIDIGGDFLESHIYVKHQENQ